MQASQKRWVHSMTVIAFRMMPRQIGQLSSTLMVARSVTVSRSSSTSSRFCVSPPAPASGQSPLAFFHAMIPRALIPTFCIRQNTMSMHFPVRIRYVMH